MGAEVGTAAQATSVPEAIAQPAVTDLAHAYGPGASVADAAAKPSAGLHEPSADVLPALQTSNECRAGAGSDPSCTLPLPGDTMVVDADSTLNTAEALVDAQGAAAQVETQPCSQSQRQGSPPQRHGDQGMLPETLPLPPELCVPPGPLPVLPGSNSSPLPETLVPDVLPETLQLGPLCPAVLVQQSPGATGEEAVPASHSGSGVDKGSGGKSAAASLPSGLRQLQWPQPQPWKTPEQQQQQHQQVELQGRAEGQGGQQHPLQEQPEEPSAPQCSLWQRLQQLLPNEALPSGTTPSPGSSQFAGRQQVSPSPSVALQQLLPLQQAQQAQVCHAGERQDTPTLQQQQQQQPVYEAAAVLARLPAHPGTLDETLPPDLMLNTQAEPQHQLGGEVASPSAKKSDQQGGLVQHFLAGQQQQQPEVYANAPPTMLDHLLPPGGPDALASTLSPHHTALAPAATASPQPPAMPIPTPASPELMQTAQPPVNPPQSPHNAQPIPSVPSHDVSPHHLSPPPLDLGGGLFSSAGGRKIVISEAALARAGAMWQDVESAEGQGIAAAVDDLGVRHSVPQQQGTEPRPSSPDVFHPPAPPPPPDLSACFLSSAAGRKITVSEAALARAGALLGSVIHSCSDEHGGLDVAATAAAVQTIGAGAGAEEQLAKRRCQGPTGSDSPAAGMVAEGLHLPPGEVGSPGRRQPLAGTAAQLFDLHQSILPAHSPHMTPLLPC